MINKRFFLINSLIIMGLMACGEARKSEDSENASLVDSTTIDSAMYVQRVNEQASIEAKNDNVRPNGQRASEPVNQLPISLKESFKEYFPIGAAVDEGPFLNSKSFAEKLVEQYNSITPANQFKPHRTQPSENKFIWKNADKIVNFATVNNMKLRGHFLISAHNMPAWFFKDGERRVSKEVLLERMKTHIFKIMNRYKGKVYCWDVVNEAVSNNKDDRMFRKGDLFYEIIGEDYVGKAFEFAHAADPNAVLFYNDNTFYEKWKRDKIYSLISGLMAKGVPIHGVGIQGHFRLGEFIKERDFNVLIDSYRKIGLQVQITELDVSIFDKKMTTKTIKFFSDEHKTYTKLIQDEQAKIYSMVFRVCRENKDVVSGITLWAPADWDNSLTKKYGTKNYPYLFDRNFKAKPWLKDVLNF